ncbi:MAG TPA: bifunctional pyridoxamine 5'-phosphate oxidase family protein/GNAT family N-acetyltransferase [Planosporangium sp.]|jgi:RimJ/RimL family protein N-acetyltransferase/nitroimidazol reductase NimA-like FMN-containing flavoprotein (pyridoxamine 5'-phosphate oxidase superfamily)|nr:bifunctional pyridoxamine 5'-phosphate oxidase family protein/GNAT family N-acetyltransferase [Planosporangium sp.]
MYPKTPRTSALRDRDRIVYDADVVHPILDEAHLCHLGFVVDGEPRVLPTLHVRVGDTLYVHGSTGSRPLLAARGPAGLPVCVAVTLLDGLVLARSQFEHSANYRSVIAHGVARLVEDEADKRRVLTALVDKIGVGRAADSRPPTDKELAQTALLALPLREVSAKVRTGGVIDEPADHALPHWAGVVPLRLTAGLPQPDPGVTVPVPGYLRPSRSDWLEPVAMRGSHVTLEPLDESHVDDLFAATADDEVWRWLRLRRPADRDGIAALVTAALAEWYAGSRVPWAQRDAVTGEVIGTTSYYAIDPVDRAVAIGHTFIGRPWWRTGVNTESKLLLLGRAFDDLGAERVEWHTDIRNERSQRAIERLGSTREGILRRHRQRPDGSWRDTVLYSMTSDEWPAARERLTARLAEMPR